MLRIVLLRKKIYHYKIRENSTSMRQEAKVIFNDNLAEIIILLIIPKNHEKTKFKLN